ncbi:MAG: aminomethyltransferase family protein, partial [Sutterella sp.]|nr:aminomethyltransferase family protein [Sutterella sp.]
HVFWLGGPLASDTLKKVSCSVPKAGSFTEPEDGVQVCAFEDIFLIQGEASKLDAFWKKLAAAGAAPIGEEVWEAARTAICFPAFGCDFDESSSPLEVGLGSSVDFSDPARMFIGRALTEARYRAGIRCRLGLLEIQSDDDASKLDSAPEVVIRGNSSEGGIITTWTLSDSGTILALALLPAESHIGDEAEVSYRAGGEDRVCAGKVIRLR